MMNEIKIVKELMGIKKMSGAILANKLGYNTPSAVSNRLQSKTMTVEKLLELLDAMDCELIIRNTIGDRETYVVDNEDRNDVKIYKKKKGGEE